MAESQFTGDLLADLRRDMQHEKDLASALASLVEECGREAIPIAIVGALALREHGYVRFTEDIDLVTTRDGLDRMHASLVGRGLVARRPGLRKKLRDTLHKVNVDIITAGEHAGSGSSPVVYPDPSGPEFSAVKGGIRFATLTALMTFKLASGIWGKRPKDLVDAQELIKANKLDPSFAMKLIPELREKFNELVVAAGEERELEE